jgi:hypothetical protein
MVGLRLGLYPHARRMTEFGMTADKWLPGSLIAKKLRGCGLQTMSGLNQASASAVTLPARFNWTRPANRLSEGRISLVLECFVPAQREQGLARHIDRGNLTCPSVDLGNRQRRPWLTLPA